MSQPVSNNRIVSEYSASQPFYKDKNVSDDLENLMASIKYRTMTQFTSRAEELVIGFPLILLLACESAAMV